MDKLSRSGLILCFCLAGCATKPPPIVATQKIPKVNSLSVATPPPPATPPPMRRSSAQMGRQTLYVGPPPKAKVRPAAPTSSPRNESVANVPAARQRTTTVIRPAQPQATYPVRTSPPRVSSQPQTIELLPPPPLPPGYSSSLPPMANHSGNSGWGQRPNNSQAMTAETILQRQREERQERIRRNNEAIIRASQPQGRGQQWPSPYNYSHGQVGGPPPPYPRIPGGW